MMTPTKSTSTGGFLGAPSWVAAGLMNEEVHAGSDYTAAPLVVSVRWDLSGSYIPYLPQELQRRIGIIAGSPAVSTLQGGVRETKEPEPCHSLRRLTDAKQHAAVVVRRRQELMNE